MRSSPFLFAAGLGLAATIAVVGCSSDETSTGSTASTQTSANSTTGDATSSTSASTGGGTGGSGTTGSSTSSSTSSGTGGSSGEYQGCGECTDVTNGAPSKECKTQNEACEKDDGCQKITTCVFNSPDCTTDQAGGCCVLKCFESTGASQAAINLYKASDSCVYCQTCKTLCTASPFDATAYCKVFEPGGDASCAP